MKATAAKTVRSIATGRGNIRTAYQKHREEIQLANQSGNFEIVSAAAIANNIIIPCLSLVQTNCQRAVKCTLFRL